MPEVLRQATVVCLPSYREGMPKALMEAAAIGRAIVTTDVPGCRDAVANGQIGRLVPVKNALALATAVGELLEDHLARHRLAEAAGRFALENFSDTSVLQKHLQLYDSLLSR
jgi:glycosyltransferase involved in cell wall biosynthesis